jgi:iron complex outermembrane recepter protein
LFHSYNAAQQNYQTTNMMSYSHGDSFSVFAQARWTILPTLELDAGARYTHDAKDSSITNNGNNPNFPGLYPEGQALQSNYSDSNVSPEVTLSWHPETNQTLYAAYKTGYKAGGISDAYLVYANSTPSNIQFRPENVKGEEIGYNATLFNQLRLGLTGYHYHYDNLQVVSYNATTIDFTVGNAASALIQGVQGQFEWLATQSLTFRGNIGYNHARYQSFSNAQCYEGQTEAEGCVNGAQNLAGKPLLRAPNLTYALGADYKVNLTTDWTAAFSMQGNYSSSFQTAADYSPGGYQESFWLLDASARLTYRDKYELAFLGRDLTNSYYTLNTVGWSGSANPEQYVGFFNRPREVILQATARF